MLLLRRAALSAPDIALEAWREWNTRTDPWRHDPGSRWWFPLIWSNLRQRLGDDERRMLQQDYTASWLRHQHFAPALAALLMELQRRGIETLLLKGVALALTAYEKPALRPFGDIDILVRPEHALRARQTVEGLGWVPMRSLPPALLPTVHSLGYVDARGIDIDLHWYALAECTGLQADHGFWERAVTTTLETLPVRALCPSDQLLHACLHGVRFTWTRTDHWIADAVTILRREGASFDWNACVAEARRRAMTWQLGRALDLVRREDPRLVPDDVSRRLRRASRWWEPIEYRAKRKASTHPGVVVQSTCAEFRSQAMGHRGSVLTGISQRLQLAAAAEGPARLLKSAVLSLAGRRGPASIRFIAYDRLIHLTSDVDARVVRAALEARLPTLHHVRERRSPDRVYQLLHAPGAVPPIPAYRVLVNRAPLAATATLDEAMDMLVGDVQAFLAAAVTDRTFVHAGAVELRGRGIILPGISGSGKSTLVAALLRAGAVYLSDEFAVLDGEGRVHPYSRPLRLRGAGGTDTRIRARALGAREATGPLRVDVIVLASFAPEQSLRVERLSASHALVRLLSHCPGAQARPESTLATLKHLVTHAPVWAVARGDTDSVVAALTDGPLSVHP